MYSIAVIIFLAAMVCYERGKREAVEDELRQLKPTNELTAFLDEAYSELDDRYEGSEKGIITDFLSAVLDKRGTVYIPNP